MGTPLLLNMCLAVIRCIWYPSYVVNKFDVCLCRVQQTHCSFTSAYQLSFAEGSFPRAHFSGQDYRTSSLWGGSVSSKASLPVTLSVQKLHGDLVFLMVLQRKGHALQYAESGRHGSRARSFNLFWWWSDLSLVCNITCINAILHWLKVIFWVCDSSSQTWVKKKKNHSSYSSTQDIVVVFQYRELIFGCGNNLINAGLSWDKCLDWIFDITSSRIKIQYSIS